MIHRGSLAEHGSRALDELHSQGYSTPNPSDPVRVYPTGTSDSFTSRHAGGWRPGVISLREPPGGDGRAEVYLRHELMHEACFRTCGGKLSLWAEEAAAIAFSGELPLGSVPSKPTPQELDHLRRRVRIGANLDRKNFETLSKLVAGYGWPAQPCATSQEIQRLLTSSESSEAEGFSYLLTSLISGRVLDAKGDLEGRYPPGSLLKIPYAAALTGPINVSVGEELVTSDTDRLLKRRKDFDLRRYRFLISPIKDTELARNLSPEELSQKENRIWRLYLGDRDAAGDFPLEANLKEMALVLRLSLLSSPHLFSALAQNGFVEGSTLFQEPEEDKAALRRIHAMAKTGTVADSRGNPLVGHLMVAWPAEAPAFLAVFRCIGINGASVIRQASPLLDSWSRRFPAPFAKVRVRLLTLVPPSFREVIDECPTLEREKKGGWKERISACGRFRVASSARGSHSERFVSGLILVSPDGEKLILETDAESFADGVLSAEAQDIQGEARKAFRAVVVWNGAHGNTRHQDTGALCDTTHCMVFMGRPLDQPERKQALTEWNLLRFLDERAARDHLDWFPFSKGGNQRWKKEVTAVQMKKLVKEPEIFDIRRERARNGEILIHLLYPTNHETVPCEIFRNKLKLLSCPEVIRHDSNTGAWVFEGIGEGHGQGISLEKAQALAQGGHTAPLILSNAYP